MTTTKEKILIVDDERFVRMTLSEALRSWNYEAFEAGTILEARTVFEREEPSIVLLDIDLPALLAEWVLLAAMFIVVARHWRERRTRRST